LSKKGLFFLFFSLFISLSGSSQDYNSYSFNELYGFDVNTVYDIFQDRDANMWFGTSEGLVRFNGVDCQFFSHEDYSKSCTNIKEDSQGRIWFSNFGGQLFYIENDAVHVAIEKAGSNQFISEYHVEWPNVVYIEYDGKEVIRINIESQLTSVIFQNKSAVIITSDDSNERLSFVMQDVHNIDDSGRISFCSYKSSSKQFHIDVRHSMELISSKYQVIIDKDDTYFLRSHALFEFYKIEGDRLSKILESNVTGALSLNQVDICGGQIHALKKKGFYSFDLTGELLDMNPHFDNSSISRVFRDQENNWWIGTLNDGLHIITNRELKSVEISNTEIVHSCKDDNDILYYVNREGDFFELKPPYNLPKLIENSQMSLGKKIAFNPYNKSIYFHGESFVYNTISRSFSEIPNRKMKVNFRDITFFNEKTAVFSSFNTTLIENLSKTSIEEKIPNYPFERITEPTLKILKDVNSFHVALEENRIDLYVSYLDGLYHYFEGGVDIVKNKRKPFSVKSMIQAKGRGVWVGTMDNQLLNIVSGKIKKSFSINKPFKGIVEHENYLFLWAKDKIIRFNISNEKIDVLDRTDGLLKDRIVNIYILNYQLVVIGRGSVQIIPIAGEWRNQNAPHLRIESMLLFDKSIQRADFNFKHEENSITINFSATAIRSQGSCSFQYRLNGGKWIETTIDAPFARFPQLAPGKYRFEVQALNEDGVKSEIKIVEFSIDVHFTRKWWFIGLVLLLISGTIYWIVKYRFNLIRKQIEIKEEQQQIRKELYKSKIAAIRAQMNPHFMFNALNTIQEFIITNQKEVASEYLADFADLMRKYLEQSKCEEITISEEIETLEIYLSLEDLRVDGQLNYSIQCEPTMNPYEITLPVMLLQPFIENSIKHGLLHKEGEKRMSISFRMKSQNRIECIIEDNGVGRAASEMIKANRTHNHDSFATDAINNKVDLVNKSSERNLSIEIIDLFSGDEAKGTKIIVELDV
jgi:hypothetical protein